MNRRGRVLAIGPKVGAQAPAGNSAVRGVVDEDRKGASATFPANGAIDGCRVDATRSGDALGSVGGGNDDFHTYQVRISCEKSNGKDRSGCEIAENAKLTHPLKVSKPRIQRPNDPWPQRFETIERIDAEVAKLMASGMAETEAFEALAKQFGMETPYSLVHGWRFNYDHKPSLTAIENMAEYWDLPIATIYNPKPTATKDQVKDELTLAKEALAGAMGADTVAKLTDEQIVSAYRVAMATAKAMLAQ